MVALVAVKAPPVVTTKALLILIDEVVRVLLVMAPEKLAPVAVRTPEALTWKALLMLIDVEAMVLLVMAPLKVPEDA